MSVLITGVTGFVGSRLAGELVQRGFNVYGLVRHDSFEPNLPSGIRAVTGDLTDPASLASALAVAKPEIVLHLAAFTPVRFSFAKPVEYAMVNYVGTVNLVQAILGARDSVRQIIQASTAEAYAPKSGFLTEEDALFGSTPYGISKAAADFYMQMARKAFSLPVTIMRPSNTFGRPFSLPEEARGYLVEKAIIQMLTSHEAVFDGFPEPKRCWMHIDDHVSAYLSVIGNDRVVGETFNASSNHPMSVGEVVESVRRITDFDGPVRWGVNPRPYDPKDLCIDAGKLMRLTGWRPKWSVEEALRKTVDYWKEKLQTVVKAPPP